MGYYALTIFADRASTPRESQTRQTEAPPALAIARKGLSKARLIAQPLKTANVVRLVQGDLLGCGGPACSPAFSAFGTMAKAELVVHPSQISRAKRSAARTRQCFFTRTAPTDKIRAHGDIP